MIKHQKLEPEFVLQVPDQLEPGVIYVSMEFGTAAHSCCCGCGETIWTPFTPKGWHLTYDGEDVSLWPSIGNWSLPCQSHYVIRRGDVIDAGPRHVMTSSDSKKVDVQGTRKKSGFWLKLLSWMGNKDR